MTLPTGIRRLPSGRYQVRIRLAGVLHAKGFPKGTPLDEMIRWREAKYFRASQGEPDPDTGPSFAVDCRRYLSSVRSMPSYATRAQHLRDWQQALGSARSRQAITASDIRRVLDGWRRRRPHPLSGASCNRRRTALMAVWTALDGRHAPNPVKDVPRYPEPVTALRLPSLKDVEAVLAVFATDAEGKPYPLKGRKSRARLRVLLWTGWPPAQLMKLTPRDVDLEAAIAHLPPRRKGRGAPGCTLPLLPQAVAALRDLDACDGWGPFSTHSLRARLHDACDRAGIRRFRVYDLRHLFQTLVAVVSKDDRAVAVLGQHTSTAQTWRYTQDSVDARVRAALDAVAHATFARHLPENTAIRGTGKARRKA